VEIVRYALPAAPAIDDNSYVKQVVFGMALIVAYFVFPAMR
jgi:hypothetical protein